MKYFYIAILLCCCVLLESGPVSALEVNSVNDTTLLISWGEPVSPNGNILNYSITITDLRDDSTVRSEFKNTSFKWTNLGKHNIATTAISSHELRPHLEPGVPYGVSVSAVNRAGRGEMNTAINFTRELKSISPSNVTAIRTTPTDMVVSWRRLTLAEAMGFITHYTVRYSTENGIIIMTMIVKGMDANTTTIKDLDPNSDYNVQVLASNAAGDGELSVTVTALSPKSNVAGILTCQNSFCCLACSIFRSSSWCCAWRDNYCGSSFDHHLHCNKVSLVFLDVY